MKRQDYNFSKYDKKSKKRKIFVILAVFLAPVLILVSLLVASACQAQPLEVFDQGPSRSGVYVFYDYGGDPGIVFDYVARTDNQGSNGFYGNINDDHIVIFADDSYDNGEKTTLSSYIYSGVGLNYGVVDDKSIIPNEVKAPVIFHYDNNEGKVYVPQGMLQMNIELANTFAPHIFWDDIPSQNLNNPVINNSQMFYMSANTSLLIGLVSLLAIISIVVGIKYFSLRKHVSFEKEYRPILQKALMFLAMTWFVRALAGEQSIFAKLVDFVKSIFMK